MIWKIRDRHLSLERTLLMGIVNLTPDSFSDAGQHLESKDAAEFALKLIDQGADIIDLGAESTRPGASAVSADEEISRLLPVIEEIRRKSNIPISIDTTKSEVARACLQAGAHIINDVSGLKNDPAVGDVVREFEAGLIIMHRRGTPETMQAHTQYQELVGDILEELRESIDIALRAGLAPLQLVVDPGLGFAKDADQNLQILAELERFHELKLPVLLGPSRKSFIGHITGREVGKREYGTAAVICLAVLKGVHIVRVHHVEAMKDVVNMIQSIQGVHYVRAF